MQRAALRCDAALQHAALRCNTALQHCVATLRCNTVPLLGMQRIDIPLPVLQAVTNLHDDQWQAVHRRPDCTVLTGGSPTSYK
jgi:hypothetical protein